MTAPADPVPDPVPDTPPAGVDPEALLDGTVAGYVDYARALYYPEGTGEWEHLPHYSEWKTIYWVPSDSTFKAPNGELVMRGQRCRGGTTAVLEYTNGTNCARVVCPEVFTNATLGRWGEVDLWRGVIVQGFHLKNPGFLGHTDWPTYKSAADATAKTNPVTTVRPGYWRYNPWDLVGGTTATDEVGAIDNKPGTGQMHERSLYLRPGSGVPSEKSFYALEGTYLEGDWVPEGLNVNGINADGSTRVVVAGFRHDRASVYFRKSRTSDDYSGKWPGGDPMQWFGNINDIVVVGGTALTHYQGQFMQHSKRKMIHVRDFNSRVPTLEANGDPTYYGGHGGYQADLGSSRDDWVEYDFRNWYVWRNGATTVDPPLFPEIKSQLVPDFIEPAEIGVTYAANPVPAERTGLATLATVGPLWAESDPRFTVLNGTQTITTDGYVLEDKIVNGYIVVRANNVTIRNVYQHAPAYSGTSKQFGVRASDVNATTLVPYTGLVVENVSLDVPAANRTVYQGSGIAGGNYTLRNVHITGYVDGWGLFGSGAGHRRYADIDRVFVHDLPRFATDPDQSDGSHGDGGQDQGLSKLILTRSVIRGGSTSAVLVQQNIATPAGMATNHESVTIEDNDLDIETTGGSVLNISETGRGVIANLTVRRNRFGRTDPTKPRCIVPSSTRNATTTVIADNVYADDGTLVPITNGG